MTYPVVVFVIAILAVVGMLLFIVPVFAGMFDEPRRRAAAAHADPRVAVAGAEDRRSSRSSSRSIVFAVWWGKHKNDRGVRETVDPCKLKVPVFGKLFQKIAVSRFTRNFGTMIHAGVPILQALDIVGETSGNLVIETRRQGRPGVRAARRVARRAAVAAPGVPAHGRADDGRR